MLNKISHWLFVLCGLVAALNITIMLKYFVDKFNAFQLIFLYYYTIISDSNTSPLSKIYRNNTPWRYMHSRTCSIYNVNKAPHASKVSPLHSDLPFANIPPFSKFFSLFRPFDTHNFHQASVDVIKQTTQHLPPSDPTLILVFTRHRPLVIKPK